MGQGFKQRAAGVLQTLTDAPERPHHLEERLAGKDGSSFKVARTAHPTLLRPFDAEDSGFAFGSHATEAMAALRRQVAEQRKPPYMLAPDSLFRKLWDTIAVLLILFLSISVPLSMAFYAQTTCSGRVLQGLPEEAYEGVSLSTRGTFVISCVTAIFFAVDIALNFFTGYYRDAQQRLVEYRLDRIAKRYACSYLLTDVLACIPFNCIMVSCNPSLNYYNTGELFKLLRIYGIGRREFGSPFSWIDRISEVRKDFSFQARRIVTLFYIFLAGIHWFACILWIVLRAQHFPEGTFPVDLGIVDGTVAVQWLWSFYNTFSDAATLGAYTPVTWPEALLYIFSMTTLNMLYIVLTGFIFAYILAVSAVKQEYMHKMDQMMFTLKERGVPGQLRDQIADYMQSKYVGRRVAHDEDSLRDLPPAIRAQVALLSAGRMLSRVPLLARHPALLEEVAPLLQRTVALPGQVILQQDHLLQSVYFIVRGFVDLTATLPLTGSASGEGLAGAKAAGFTAESDPDAEPAGSTVVLVDMLGPGDRFPERALLPLGCGLREQLVAGGGWRAPFTATALDHCELLELPVAAWQGVVANHADVADELAAEADR
ncbi:hypothetical protein COHA_002447 [Chlorella ohadii]|nr:hypothetical protein COHA_002447 [Chlorella ohadii]